MFRRAMPRLVARSIAIPASHSGPAFPHVTLPFQWASRHSSVALRRPQLTPILAHGTIWRRNVSEKQHKAEDRYAHEKLKPTPETVSSTSSTNAMSSVLAPENVQQDPDVTAGLRHDVGMIRDTFSLSSVPREAYYMGLAGTLPYLATSLSTVYCAWEINHANAGYGMLIDESTATQILHILEPLQIGYGASILSFLGAIHWGLEWAGYGGYQGYKRYAIGVVAPAVAWSTILMPIEGALITQFLGFVGLYYIDTRATVRGWVPGWYGVYRFVLTFIVGASIVVSLIGRGELPDHVPGAVDRAKVFKDPGSSEEKLAQDEEALVAKKKNAARSDDRSEH